MTERATDVKQEPESAPPARATDPQKPGEPLRPGPQGGAGTTGPAGGVAPERADARPGQAGEGGPDDRGRKEGDGGGL
jgi:hypothetical protein